MRRSPDIFRLPGTPCLNLLISERAAQIPADCPTVGWVSGGLPAVNRTQLGQSQKLTVVS